MIGLWISWALLTVVLSSKLHDRFICGDAIHYLTLLIQAMHAVYALNLFKFIETYFMAQSIVLGFPGGTSGKEPTCQYR